MNRPLVVAVAILAAAAAPARAQSRRYPPEPVDRDEEQAKHSNLWETAANPQRTPYGKLIFEAEQLLRDGTTAGTQEAVRRLDEAVKLLPAEPKAYRLRGEASLRLKDWPRCAEDLASAWARETAGDAGGEARGAGSKAREARGGRGARGAAGAARPRDPLDPRQATELRRKIGICQARAGRLADAERTLAEAAATGNATGEIWVRLGEVRIAMGKLEEAIAALESVGEQNDAPPALIQWLLAGAYDRARRPAESIEAARKAYTIDPTFSTLRNGQLPLLGAGEPEYLQGLTYLAKDKPQPDYALVYFRYFLQIAKDSPWRKRAEEHLRDIKAAELPETIERRDGHASIDLLAARAVVRKAMPAMRACAAKTPFIIYEVAIVKAGPRTPPAPLDRPRFFTPPDSVTVTPMVGLPSTGDVPQADRDGVVRCIEPIASKITFPPIKEKDTHFKLSFYVIAP